MADINWIFEMVDKVSKPLDDVQKKLDAMPKSADAVEKAIAKVERAMMLKKIQGTSDPLQKTLLTLKAQQKALKENGGVLGWFKDKLGGNGVAAGVAGAGVLLFASAAGSLMHSLLGAGVGMAKLAFESSEGKRAMMGALEVFEGSGTDAAFDTLQQMGIKAGVSADATVEAFTRMRTAGFKAKEAQDIIAASFDLSAKFGGGEKGLEHATKFQDLMAKVDVLSKSGAKDMKAAVLGAGVNIDALQASVAQRMKVPVDQAKTLLAEGKVGEATMKNALIDAVQDSLDNGGALGSNALKFAKGSIVAQVTSLKGVFDNIFEDVNLGPFASVLGRITDELSRKGGPADKLKAMAGGAFEMVGAFTSGIDIAGVIGTVVDWIGKGGDLIGELVSGFNEVFNSVMIDTIDQMSGSTQGMGMSFEDVKMVIHATGQVLGTMVTIGYAVGKAVIGVVETIAEAVMGLGMALGWILDKMGLIGEEAPKFGGAFKDGLDQGTNAIKGGKFADTVYDEYAVQPGAKMEVASPSKVTTRIGGHIAEGYNVGFDDKIGTGDVQSFLSSDSVAFDSSGYSDSGSGIRDVNVTFGDIYVNGDSASAIANDLRAQVRVEVIGLFEEMGQG